MVMSDDKWCAIVEQMKGVDDLCDYCSTQHDDDCYNCEHNEEETDKCRLVEMFIEKERRGQRE